MKRLTRPVRVYDDDHRPLYMVAETDAYIDRIEADNAQLRTERDRLIEGHRLIDGFARSILEEPTNPNHVSMRAGNIRSWIRINTTLNKEATDEQ